MSERESKQHVLGLPVWAKFAAVSLLALVTVAVAPRVATRGGLGPSVALLVGVGAVVAALAGVALYLTVRRDLRLGVAAALYAVGFNVLVVAVKFVFSPYGIYEIAGDAPFPSFLSLNEDMGALLVATMMFLLYALVYVIVYRMVRGRVAADRTPKRWGIVLVIVGLLLLATISGGAVVLLVTAMEGLNYLDLVFSSSLSVFMALALYHVLWVVYVLVLTTLWPLKVVTPK